MEVTHIRYFKEFGNEEKQKNQTMMHDVKAEEGSYYPHYKAVRKL